MAGRMRHAGIHWPANAGGEHPDREMIYRMPGVEDGALLMLADSARYWYGEARSRCPLVVWRGLPRPGKLPADLKWNATRVAAECVNLWDEAPHEGTEWFVPLNELQFPKESGQDFPGYAKMAENLGKLRQALRTYFSKRGEDVRLLFPAWVPGDDLEHADEWFQEADQWDGYVLHAYGSASEIADRWWAYRALFGVGVPALLGEWNKNRDGSIDGEEEILSGLEDIAVADRDFLGATYYIWETNNDGEHGLSIWGNDQRLALFESHGEAPPVPAPEPAPVDPAPPPEPPPAPVPDPLPEPEPVVSGPDPWEFWSADTIATASGCDLSGITDNWPRIVAQLALCDEADRPVQAAVIATVAIETASSFRPVREAFYLGEPEPAESWRRANLRYYPDYGRGFIQRTWADGYAAAGPAIAKLWGAGADDPTFDLTANPDNLLNPDMAAADLAIFWRDTATLQGYSLVAASRARDYEWIRRLVQGGTDGLPRLTSIMDALLIPAGAQIPPSAPLVYVATVPPERQVQPWACSIRTTMWDLDSLGYDVDAGTMQADMLGHGEVTPADGLQDHRGYGIAAALARHLPAGTPIEVLEAPTWEDVISRAGRGPIALGSTSLNHWLAVADWNAALGVLVTANPAPNYPASKPLGDTLSRADWDAWPGWSAVFVEVTPPPPAPEDTIAKLRNLVGNAYNDDGQIVPVLRQIVAGSMTKAQMQDAARGLIGFLEDNRPS